MWVAFLDEVARRRLDVEFFATIRATDIVRDADVMDSYRRAGLRYVLLGIDTTDPSMLERIRKRSTTDADLTACGLLRRHGIHPIIGHIVGLGEDTWADVRRARRALAAYDDDYLNAMYATPHSWTAFAREHLRPRRLVRLLLQRDRSRRREAWWTAWHTGLVWLAEIADFAFRVRFARRPRPLADTMPGQGRPG